MSSDPFENSTTVKNILQHMISPKIISDGGNGYVVRTDLTHVHNLIFAKGSSNEDGSSSSSAFTTQCGTSTFPVTPTTSIVVYHSRVTTNSIIMASAITTSAYTVLSIVPAAGSFTITLSGSIANVRVGWFIARF
jgi:hypothetical protein